MTEPEDLRRRFLTGVDRLGRALRKARQDVATQHRLSPLQVQLLEHVATHKPQRVGSLAAELDVRQPTVSDALDALEVKGLMQRVPDPRDGRASILVLTNDGERVAGEISAAFAPLLSADGGDVDLGAGLHAVLSEIKRLQVAGVISVNRSCLTCTHYRAETSSELARCLFLDESLRQVDLRVDCSDHLSVSEPD